MNEPCLLVVDDVPANVALLTAILSRAGFANVHSTSDATTVVSLCEELQPDVVFLDLHMPFLDGFGVMAALKDSPRVDPLLPVVVLTADVTSESRQAALEAGATDFLTKPFDAPEVILRTRNLLHTRSLYLRLQERNDDLQQQVEEQAEAERRRADVQRIKRQRIEGVLAQANAMHMVFQPIVRIDGGDIVGYEALARFSPAPVRTPDRWFAEAAQVGLGIDLELTAVGRALEQRELLGDGTVVAVNVSPATATCPGLERVLAGTPGHRVILELTEHDRVDDYDAMMATLDRLRAQGVRIAVDDAGTGYAGLQHILRLRPDVLKLDRDLISRIDGDPARLALASALTSFARDIGAVLIAEGIETQRELDVLRELGVPWGQGYFLARPASVDSLRATADVPGGTPS